MRRPETDSPTTELTRRLNSSAFYGSINPVGSVAVQMIAARLDVPEFK